MTKPSVKYRCKAELRYRLANKLSTVEDRTLRAGELRGQRKVHSNAKAKLVEVHKESYCPCGGCDDSERYRLEVAMLNETMRRALSECNDLLSRELYDCY